MPGNLPALFPHRLQLHTRQDLFLKVQYASVSIFLKICQATAPGDGAAHGIPEPNFPDPAVWASVLASWGSSLLKVWIIFP